MKKLNKLFCTLLLLSCTIFSACGQAKSDASNVAVLELFTSQGCSSCPPADKVLEKYALNQNPNIIALAFHVDYWNRLGWKDPFSKTEFSNRQREYAQKLNSNVYTPQLVINGTKEIVGSDETGVERLVSEQVPGKTNLLLTITTASILENQLLVEYKTNITNENQVVNIALVKKKEVTNIKRGENSGLKQINYNIVYDFKSMPLNKKGNIKQIFDFKKEWSKSDFFVVAYIQNRDNFKIQKAVIQEIN